MISFGLMKKQIYKWLFFRVLGWRIEGFFDPKIKQCVIMVLPHTSWHDFFIGLFVRGIVNLPMHFVAKKELFNFPFGWYFKWIGGAPLDRSGGLNKVDAIANLYKSHSEFRLAIAPEGTRKKVTQLRSGFYYIAVTANVPIVPVAFDFEKKLVSISEPFYPSKDYTKDLPILMEYFKNVKGKHPDAGFQI